MSVTKSLKYAPSIFFMSICLSVLCKNPRTSERVLIKYGSNRKSTTNIKYVNTFLEVL
jgi:hypothetical protein